MLKREGAVRRLCRQLGCLSKFIHIASTVFYGLLFREMGTTRFNEEPYDKCDIFLFLRGGKIAVDCLAAWLRLDYSK